MDLQLLNGLKFGAFLITEIPGAKDEYGAIEGTAKWDGENLSIVTSSSDSPPFPIPANAFDRIKAVDARMRVVFDSAEYYVPLIMKPLDPGADTRNLQKAGYRWPKGDAEPGAAADRGNGAGLPGR
jgi:hypothetical protein